MSVVEWDVLSHDIINDLFAAEVVHELDLGDRYTVQRVLGQGGQGIVYLAQDLHVDREVAIKCAHDGNLKAEVQLLSTLAHPGIPQVYDQGQATDGTHFMVMQYIDGQRLDHYLQQTNPSTDERIQLFREVGAAVHHAHERGILHRDLKPSNIIVNFDRGNTQVTIIDWGLAATGDPRAICGSPHFAAPEQLDGQPADKRADIFALGVLLYFIISGELPYARRVTNFNEFRTVRAGLQRIPLNRVCPQAPAYLEKTSARAMSAQAGARYGDIPAMIDDIDSHQQRSQRGIQSMHTIILMLLLLLGLSYVLGKNIVSEPAGVTSDENTSMAVDFNTQFNTPLDASLEALDVSGEIDFVGPVPPKDFKWPDEDELPFALEPVKVEGSGTQHSNYNIDDLPRLEDIFKDEPLE